MRLKDAKVGYYIKTNNYGQINLYKIERLTKTQAICGHTRFNLESGKIVGSGTWLNLGSLATVEDFEKYNAKRFWENLISIKNPSLDFMNDVKKSICSSWDISYQKATKRGS